MIEVETIDPTLLLEGKRHGTIYCTIKNPSTDKTLRKIQAHRVSMLGVELTIYEPAIIETLAPGEAKEIELRVSLPSNVPFDFSEGTDADSIKESEIEFLCYGPVSSSEYEGMPDW
jgi:hypothetical protein